jgi:hypothetical protein
MSAARPLAAVSIRAAAAELVAHAEGSGPRPFAPPAPFWSTDKGTASATSWTQTRRGPAALVKACGLHKAPLSYGREQLVAHLVINMTVLSRPALWQHAVVRRGLLDSAGLCWTRWFSEPNAGRRAATSGRGIDGRWNRCPTAPPPSAPQAIYARWSSSL